MPDNSLSLSPYYDITLKINDIDISPYIREIEYLNNINYVYPLFIIDTNINSSFQGLKFIYERAKTNLNIKFTSENKEVVDEFSFSLLILEVSGQININTDTGSNEYSLENPADGRLTLVCVPIEEFNSCSISVNYISRKRFTDTPIKAIENVLNGFFEKGKIKINIDKTNENEYVPEEIFIPIMSLSRMVNYLDYTYGIYYGAPYFYLTYDTTESSVVFNMYDIAKKFSYNEEPDIKIYYISSGDGENMGEAYKKSGYMDNIFYSRKSLTKNVKQNLTKLSNMVFGRFIIKDSGTLFEETSNLQSECLRNCISDFTSSFIQINPDVRPIEKRFIVGSDCSNMALRNTIMFKKIFDKNEYIINFERNIRLKNIFCVGISAELIFLTESQKDYGGRYVVKGSSVKFTKKRNTIYDAQANIIICRPYDIQNPDIPDNATNISDENMSKT